MSVLQKNPFNHDQATVSTPLVNVQIDGAWVQVPKGMNVVEAAKKYNKFIPHYCYHPKLSVVGNCRMCMVEMGMPKMDANRQPVLAADGKPEIAWMPRPQIGCATQVSEGMGIRTESPLVAECRKGVMEFLLINHPLDCPICDQAGECKLQEFSVEYGNSESRFVDEKVHKPKKVDIGERIILDDERCIMCSRCIRFAREVVQDDVLGFTQRGSHTTLSIYPGKKFDNNYSLNTVDICPVGALTSKDFRFKMRVWFLKETKSICTGCATGCNITIGSREGIVHRLTPRENETVNSHWMCDQGRLGFHYLHDDERLTWPAIRQQDGSYLPMEWIGLGSSIADMLKSCKPHEIAFIASARMTNEELFLLSEIRRQLGGVGILTDIVPRSGEADGFLRHADLNPNSAGAELMGLSENGTRLSHIRNGIESGSIKVLIVWNEDAIAAGIPEAILKKCPTVIAASLLPNATTQIANFVLPVAGFAEKRGSMISGGKQLQRLNKAISAPGKARDDFEILSEILASLTGDLPLSSIEEVFASMTSKVQQFSALSLSKIGDTGVVFASKV